jgi:hypothetical protein
MDCVDGGRDKHWKQDEHQEWNEGKHGSLTFFVRWVLVFDSE